MKIKNLILGITTIFCVALLASCGAKTGERLQQQPDQSSVVADPIPPTPVVAVGPANYTFTPAKIEVDPAVEKQNDTEGEGEIPCTSYTGALYISDSAGETYLITIVAFIDNKYENGDYVSAAEQRKHDTEKMQSAKAFYQKITHTPWNDLQIYVEAGEIREISVKNTILPKKEGTAEIRQPLKTLIYPYGENQNYY